MGSDLINVGINMDKLTLPHMLSFMIRGFFIVAALSAFVFLLLGALAWVTSSGEKELVKKAQDKIQAAVVGLLVIVAVLAIMVTLETVVFRGTICVGLTCPPSIPSLLEPEKDQHYEFKVDSAMVGKGTCVVNDLGAFKSKEECCSANTGLTTNCP